MHQSAIDRGHSAGRSRQVGRKKLANLGATLRGAEPPRGDQSARIMIALAAARKNRRGRLERVGYNGFVSELNPEVLRRGLLFAGISDKYYRP